MQTRVEHNVELNARSPGPPRLVVGVLLAVVVDDEDGRCELSAQLFLDGAPDADSLGVEGGVVARVVARAEAGAATSGGRGGGGATGSCAAARRGGGGGDGAKRGTGE